MLFSGLVYLKINSNVPLFMIVEEEESDESDGELELHPLLTASLRNPIKKAHALPVEPPPLPPGWTAVNPGTLKIVAIRYYPGFHRTPNTTSN